MVSLLKGSYPASTSRSPGTGADPGDGGIFAKVFETAPTWLKYRAYPSNPKHLYNICTMLNQRRRRWADVVQMLYQCFVFLEIPKTSLSELPFLHILEQPLRCWFNSGSPSLTLARNKQRFDVSCFLRNTSITLYLVNALVTM